MGPWILMVRLALAVREFVAPVYRPELHYMRGPGPAYARVRTQTSRRPFR